jgi:hypothetical protein
VLLVYLYVIGRRRHQWTPFWPPLLPAGKHISIKHRGQYKLINFYFNLLNLLNLLNRFNGILGKIMRKADHSSGGMGSSNPRRLRGWRLHDHGDGVF